MPKLLGSILTNVAIGSRKRPAIEMAPRIVTSKLGYSLDAMSEAE